MCYNVYVVFKAILKNDVTKEKIEGYIGNFSTDRYPVRSQRYKQQEKYIREDKRKI